MNKFDGQFNKKQFEEDHQMDLSQLSEPTRIELIQLETQLDKDNLTRGERRRIQNKRNKLKARIKATQQQDDPCDKYSYLKLKEK